MNGSGEIPGGTRGAACLQASQVWVVSPGATGNTLQTVLLPPPEVGQRVKKPSAGPGPAKGAAIPYKQSPSTPPQKALKIKQQFPQGRGRGVLFPCPSPSTCPLGFRSTWSEDIA